jgi:hypothetical protein
MGAELASTFYAMGYANSIASEMERNRADVLILTPEEFISILQDRVKGNPLLEANVRKELAQTSFGQYWNQTLNTNINQPFVIPVAQATNDAVNLAKTIYALGVIGATCYVKTHNGKPYLIFKGDAKLRNLLKGTRYLANNPQILQLGLGMQGLKQVAKGGFILGIVVSAGVEISDFVLNDQKTMYDLVGGIGVEAVKGGITAVLAFGAGALATGVGIAILPLGAMLAVALIVGVGLNYLDDTFEIKKNVSVALKAAASKLDQGTYWVREETLRTLQNIGNVARKDEATLRQLDNWLMQTIKQFMRYR